MSHNNNTELEQTITVPLRPRDVVTLYSTIDMDKDGGFAGSILFEGTVDTYNPRTGLLQFEDSNVGRAEFRELLDEAAGVQIVNP